MERTVVGFGRIKSSTSEVRSRTKEVGSKGILRIRSEEGRNWGAVLVGSTPKVNLGTYLTR